MAPTRVAVTANGAPNRPMRSMQLQLNPAELGTVNIRLHSVDGQLHVAIRAESDKTAEMLSRDSEAIRSALRAAGASPPSIVTVSVNRNDQTPQQFTGQNRDTSGQFAGQDNRGNTSNESRNPNREGPVGQSPATRLAAAMPILAMLTAMIGFSSDAESAASLRKQKASANAT